MNLLKIDTKKYTPKILEAVVEVFGKEYRNVLVEKASKIQNINYVDELGISHYHLFLENCIQKYLVLKFFQKIGVDISENNKSVRLRFDLDMKKKIEQYFGDCSVFRSDFWKSSEGMFSFDKEVIGDYTRTSVEEGQIEFLNFLRGKEEITISNYEEFKQTEEYLKLLQQIHEYLKLYKNLDKKKEKYYKKIQKYKDYVDSENKRKERIMNLKRCELYQEIESELPESLRKYLNLEYQTLEQKSRYLFPDLDEKKLY